VRLVCSYKAPKPSIPSIRVIRRPYILPSPMKIVDEGPSGLETFEVCSGCRGSTALSGALCVEPGPDICSGTLVRNRVSVVSVPGCLSNSLTAIGQGTAPLTARKGRTDGLRPSKGYVCGRCIGQSWHSGVVCQSQEKYNVVQTQSIPAPSGGQNQPHSCT